jgi:hypothetical protein
MKYDPLDPPDREEWLAHDEDERVNAIADHHRREKVRLPNRVLHATIHNIVETQLATGTEPVERALARLEGEGLDRHDAIHAIGSVLAEHIYEILRGGGKPLEPASGYFRKLESLSASKWKSRRTKGRG